MRFNASGPFLVREIDRLSATSSEQYQRVEMTSCPSEATMHNPLFDSGTSESRANESMSANEERPVVTGYGSTADHMVFTTCMIVKAQLLTAYGTQPCLLFQTLCPRRGGGGGHLSLWQFES